MATKHRIFAFQNPKGRRIPSQAPKALTYFDDWGLDRLLEKATSKLSPESKFSRVFAEFGNEIKRTCDIEPNKPLYFSCGEDYNGPPDPNPKPKPNAEVQDTKQPDAKPETPPEPASPAPSLPTAVESSKDQPEESHEDILAAAIDEAADEHLADELLQQAVAETATEEESASGSGNKKVAEEKEEKAGGLDSKEGKKTTPLGGLLKSFFPNKKSDEVSPGTKKRSIFGSFFSKKDKETTSQKDVVQIGEEVQTPTQENENPKERGDDDSKDTAAAAAGQESSEQRSAPILTGVPVATEAVTTEEPEQKETTGSKLNTFMSRVWNSAKTAVKERQEKIQEVLDKAKEAMDEVERRKLEKERLRRESKQKEAKAALSLSDDATDAQSRSSPADSKSDISEAPPDPVMVLEVIVKAGRDMEITRRPYALVEVEGRSKQTTKSQGPNPSWCSADGTASSSSAAAGQSTFRFPVTDLTGDVRISICDPASNRRDRKLGRVLIPIRWLEARRAGIPYGWKPFKRWLKVFPLPQDVGVADILTSQLGGVKAKADNDFEEKKFFPALPKDSGTGLIEPDTPMGDLQVEVIPYPAKGITGVASSFFQDIRSGASEVRWTEVDAEVEYFLEEDNEKVLSVEGFNRLLHRIKLLTHGAPLLFTPPFSVGTIVWLYIACFRSSQPDIPWLILMLLALQGVALWCVRNLSTIIVWEKDIKKGKAKSMFEYGAIVRKVLRIIGAYQYKAELVVSTLERVKNALSGADMFASMLLYTSLAILALAAQFVLSILPSGLPYFLIGIGILSGPYFKLYRRMRNIPKKKKGEDWLDRLLGYLLWKLENFFNHVPDGNEMAHRHICEMQLAADKKTRITNSVIKVKKDEKKRLSGPPKVPKEVVEEFAAEAKQTGEDI
mmetsp:Transcript_1071/g.1840  ORF Transcript_1071/g.1840 Transcript_1071/m.1840 type:complete len:899 (-) Transcript_1071:129-2825(-)